MYQGAVAIITGSKEGSDEGPKRIYTITSFVIIK